MAKSILISATVVAAAALMAVPVTMPAQAAPSAPAQIATRDVRVFADTALRESPAGDGALIRIIPANSFAFMSEESAPDGWLRVIVDGRAGYVSARYAEGPWLTTRTPGDSSLVPVPEATRQKIIELNL